MHSRPCYCRLGTKTYFIYLFTTTTTTTTTTTKQHATVIIQLNVVCAQRCSSSGVPASTLRPHHWRPCNPPLAACTTTGRLQSCGHGVSSTEWSVSAIPGSASLCCWSAWSSSSALMLITPAAGSGSYTVQCSHVCCVSREIHTWQRMTSRRFYNFPLSLSHCRTKSSDGNIRVVAPPRVKQSASNCPHNWNKTETKRCENCFKNCFKMF